METLAIREATRMDMPSTSIESICPRLSVEGLFIPLI